MLDKLTYSGNPANLDGTEIELVLGDICDPDAVAEAAAGCDAIVNFAAETHVDRSILGPAEFIQTNVAGTQVLLDHVRAAGIRLVHVSTDEVYGDVPEGVSSAEDDPLRPSSPYSAAKAGGDLQVLGSVRTYGIDALITRGSNTYGPNQYPEKLLPLFVTNALDGEPLPLYGDGGRLATGSSSRIIAPGSSFALAMAAPARPTTSAAARRRRTARSRTSSSSTPARTSPWSAGSRTAPGTIAAIRSTRRRSATSSAGRRRRGSRRASRTATWYAENRDWWEPIKASGGYQEYYEKQYAARLAGSGSS